MGLFDAINKTVVAAFMDRDGDQGLVTVRKGASPAVTVPAIFDAGFYASDDGEFASVDLITTISIKTADFPAASVDDVVTARGKIYRITERRPDSEGMTVLELQED